MRGALGLALAGTLVALSVAQPALAAESLDRTRESSEMRAAAPKGAARYWKSIARVSGRLAPLYRTPGIESVDIKTRGPRGFGSAVVTLKGGVDRPSLKSLRNTLAADGIRLERIPR
ncbi:MAG: hypothetical protein ACKOC3_00905, partial [Candidatus Limnocylindrus sp.]